MDPQPENKQPRSDTALAEEELEHLPKVEQILKSLTKLIHGRKLYADNNPRLTEFSREFESALSSYFKVEKTLVLDIDQYTITWCGSKVYENQKREDSIAFLLHRDGIGEISIESKAIGQEIDRLVKILTDEYHNLSSDEDVVTKFWNADFEYISYRVLDDYLAAEYGDGCSSRGTEQPPAEIADQAEILPSLEDKGRVIISQSDGLESIDAYLKKLILRTCSSTDAAEQEAYFQSTVGSFFTVSNEELNMYHEELKREKSDDNLAAFVDSIFVFAHLKGNPPAVRDVCGVVERIAEYAVGELDPLTLGKILTAILNFEAAETPTEEMEKFCRKLRTIITADEVVQTLGEKLKFWNKDSEKILDYFSVVGRAVIDPLLKVLHNVEGEKLHKKICDVLVAVTGDDIANVLERLDVEKPEVAYDAVYIANRIELTEMLPRIKELLFYPDVNVKEEMIKFVSRIDDATSIDLLLRAMDDEEKRIRFRAMEAASEKNDPRVLQRLTDLALGKELSGLDPDEQEMIFKTLGSVGNAETVEELRKFVDKKGFMQFGKQRENKFLAIRALEHIHSPASLGFLKQLTRDSNTLVQTRAQRAHDSLDKIMRAERNKSTQEDREQ